MNAVQNWWRITADHVANIDSYVLLSEIEA
jgi:hypothetical protein